MIPLYDNNPRYGRPLVTVGLILVNALVFLYQTSLEPRQLQEFIYLFSLLPARITDPQWATAAGFPGGAPLTFLSSMFLHANLLHLLGNMWMLWLFGDNIEDRLGHVRFLLFYLLCGLAAGGLHYLTDVDSRIPTLGASGAIAGVMGGYMLLFPRARVVTLVILFVLVDFWEVPAFLFLGLWLLIQIYSGAMTFGMRESAGVAFWAHVGGFAAGLLLVRLLAGRRRLPAAYAYRRRGRW